MALVSYDYDSTSETEEENIPTSSSVVVPTKNSNFKAIVSDKIKVNNSQVHNISDDELDTNIEHTDQLKNETAGENLFSSLPEIRIVFKKIVEDKIEDFIPKPKLPVKKERQKVKITIPSLSQFKDDDEPKIKKVKPLSKGSGLMALLPPVKGAVKSNLSFIPNTVSSKTKPTSSSSTNTLVPNSIRKQNEIEKVATLEKSKQKTKILLSDAESDDDLDIPETYDNEMWEKICGRPKNKPIIQEQEESPSQQTINIAPEPEKPYEGLDNIAFKELVGKSKRPMGNIRLIDINEEDILPDKDIWMAKSLTDPEMAPRAAVDDPVDPTKKKKHHITYLAQQAKANEQELKSQWAASKTNKYASRAKYGF